MSAPALTKAEGKAIAALLDHAKRNNGDLAVFFYADGHVMAVAGGYDGSQVRGTGRNRADALNQAADRIAGVSS